MTTVSKTFDAVDMMRSARDDISAKINGMTLQEEIERLESQDLGDPFLQGLRERLSQQHSGNTSCDFPQKRVA